MLGKVFGDGVCVPVVRWLDQNVLTPIYQDECGGARGVPLKAAKA